MAKVTFSTKPTDFANSFPTVNKKTVKPNKTTFEMMNVSDIKLDPKGEFQKLFPLDEVLIEKLTKSMEMKGYDKSQPLQLARILSEKENGDTLLDGHNRKVSAEKANIKEVPVYIHTFSTREEAKIYAMEDLQLHRRNLTQQQKIALIESLDSIKNPGRKKTVDNEELIEIGKSSEKTAEKIGVSSSYVEQVRNVMKNGDEETIDEMKAGTISVSAANKKTNDKKNHSKKEKEENDNLINNEGIPSGLNFNHSDGIERPDYKLLKAEDLERTQERKNAFDMGKKEGFEKGYAEGAYDIYEKIIELLEKGLSIDEVKNHELFEDFSYVIIYKKIKKE